MSITTNLQPARRNMHTHTHTRSSQLILDMSMSLSFSRIDSHRSLSTLLQVPPPHAFSPLALPLASFSPPFKTSPWIPFPRIAPSSTSTGKRSSTTSISKRTSLLCFLATSYSNRYDTQHTGRHKIKTRAEAREDDFAHTIGTQAGFCQQNFSLPHTFC